MKCFVRRSVICCVLLIAPIARGTLLLVEPFAYTNGTLVTVSGGAWNTHSGSTGEVQVVSGRAEMSASFSEDVNRLIPGQPYTSGSATILYASFTLNLASGPSGLGNYFAHIKGSGTSNYRAKVFAFSAGASPGQYRLGLAGADNSPAVTNAVFLTTNVDYQVYLRYVLNTGVATLWIDPTNEVSVSVTATDAAAASSIIAFALRQESGIGTVRVDDIRVGTSFADVYQSPTPVPPSIAQQPASTSTIEGGAAVFVVTANGSAPLSYQWRFHGTNLPGAISPTLTLTNIGLAQAGPYSVQVTNAVGVTNSAVATLTVVGASSNGLLTVVHYNIHGLFNTDWTTNAAQVQAIARQLQYLNPDIIALNEIPAGDRNEMTNWMTAFFPTYTLAISPGTDNSLHSGFISRYPITRSQSWLDGVGLTNFGFAGTFTRDLFEAEITVPGATEPLHIFTTHLKSGPTGDDQDRRAAESSAVSNFFATVFVPAYGNRPYLMTGDLNEDIDIPLSHGNQPIQRLIAAPTGLKLATPLNPFTLSRFTHSIQGSNSLDARIDYVMPAGVLASNLVTSQVFRTDKLNTLPPNLNSNDCIVASDHLPVVMVFRYPDPQLVTTLTVSDSDAALAWPALIGRRFTVERSVNLASWTVAASNITATTSPQIWTTSANASPAFFRVIRQP